MIRESVPAATTSTHKSVPLAAENGPHLAPSATAVSGFWTNATPISRSSISAVPSSTAPQFLDLGRVTSGRQRAKAGVRSIPQGITGVSEQK